MCELPTHFGDNMWAGLWSFCGMESQPGRAGNALTWHKWNNPTAGAAAHMSTCVKPVRTDNHVRCERKNGKVVWKPPGQLKGAKVSLAECWQGNAADGCLAHAVAGFGWV